MQRDIARYGNFWNRLDVILTVMSYCKGATCRNPFLRVHPDGRCVPSHLQPPHAPLHSIWTAVSNATHGASLSVQTRGRLQQTQIP